MTTLYIMIGVPGSGKTTWAHNNLTCRVVSTDDIRLELFNDSGDQRHNHDVFREAYRRVIDELSYGRDVCFDATNITKSERAKLFKELSKHDIDCRKVGVVMNTPIELCLQNNRCRKRIVPDEVIIKKTSKFQTPMYEEGFDLIETVTARCV